MYLSTAQAIKVLNNIRNNNIKNGKDYTYSVVLLTDGENNGQFDLNDFVLGNVSVSTVKDRVLGTTTYNLVVDGNAIVGEIDIYLFNYKRQKRMAKFFLLK